MTNTADSGAGSLRQTLTGANAGAATINFSITNSTINLSSMLPILTNPSSITINGKKQQLFDQLCSTGLVSCWK